ncbi:MAG: UDP-diphospho-muramoylpentapeptide beta-N- acetylglucosaminyltransferase [Candidatus Magasanikbacteria bacterium GW2011_GWA2_46_17]|uniref:UDP-diphospho-muramoylpentapeptide beta-N-acetylglucosaminyltransferase n=1 Tax=Candidatus Magasanikbacteria bacterium GW2011_GWA2_46_17 TaxID=1619042 RepID=A0A0G1P061_9BACT|nr:MAG: UDP-diphospho-muramoylpentapeptide beta-N- acetylglucosaminyltransferase [Candidatus Magasanikbacteria bacterium GW2011_GWA2_46_17]
MGPVVPLLAIAEMYKKRNPSAEFVWVGTKDGPEKELVGEYGLPFFTITHGKLRRYFSLFNLIDVVKLAMAFFQSLVLLWYEKPSLLISAGGFVSVPLHFAAYSLGIPTWVHQQDVLPGLANKLMARLAKKITTALQDSAKYYPTNRTEWIGNPARDLGVTNPVASRAIFGIPDEAPVIFALGGGTGSAKVNKMVLEALPSWSREWHIVHLVGKNRPRLLHERVSKICPNYHVYQFFTEEMKDAYAIADVVIARAGFGSITELAALSKPAIIIPMSKTHQEENALFLFKNKAVIVLDEEVDNGLKLAQIVKRLIESSQDRQILGHRLHTLLPPAKEEKVVEIIDRLVQRAAII